MAIFSSSCHRLSGEISSPINGQTVGTTIECEGSLSGNLEGKHIWIVVSEKSTEGEKLFWPKDEILHLDENGRWALKVFEDGPGTQIEILLYEVTDSVHNAFKSWLNHGAQTGSYPGLNDILGNKLAGVEELNIH